MLVARIIKTVKESEYIIPFELVATRKVFLHARVLACRRLKIGNLLNLIIFPKFTLENKLK